MVAIPKPKTFHWTSHSKQKMRFWGLSESRVRRVMHSPLRIEEGIAPGTISMMQPTTTTGTGKSKKWKQEIWVMIQEKRGARNVISAWRYPGMTKLGTALPPETLRQLRRLA
jgi:hypothetical protein